MGDSHFRSDVIALDHTQIIKGFREIKCATFTATNAVVNTALTAPAVNVAGAASANIVKATGLGDSSYVQIGVQQYAFVGNSNTGASIVAEATALVATPIKGSTYMSRKGSLWSYTTDSAAVRLGNITGDATDKLVLRKAVLLVQNGSNASTIKPWFLNTWNSENVAEEDNLAKDGDTGNYTLNSGGDSLTIQRSGLSSDVEVVISATIMANASGSDIRVDGFDSSAGIRLNFTNATSAASVDLTTLVDTGVMNVYIVYLSNG